MEKQVETIGKRIKNLRNNKKISQKELGKAIGLTQNSISKLENGDISLTLENLINIASYFNVSTDYICTGQSNENILILLEKYSKIEYQSGSYGLEHYEYPVLKICKLYFEYLMHIARARSNKYMPEDIKNMWIDKEIQEFNKSRDSETFTDYVTVVPVPNDFIYPDDAKAHWKQSDLIKEMDKFFTSNSSQNK